MRVDKYKHLFVRCVKRYLYPILSRRLVRFLDWMMKKDATLVYGGISFKESYNHVVGALNGRRYKDVVRCFIRYGITPRDYLLFGFDTINKSHKNRKSFVTDIEKDTWLIEKEGWKNYLELSDKYGFYLRCQTFFHRKVYKVGADASRNGFIQFSKEVVDLFIKPNGGSYGKGAFLCSVDSPEEAGQLFDRLIRMGGIWLAEERIRQDEEMAKWNETSVNTIRFTSCLNEKGFFTFTPVLRTGRHGSIVDNGASGGILANIDISSGRIYTDGVDEDGHVFESHPDSGIVFKGAVIPSWPSLLSTVEDVHRTVFPNHFYIGWDFAYSNSEWVLIEGNWGQFLNQYVDKRGRKNEFLHYLGREK